MSLGIVIKIPRVPVLLAVAETLSPQTQARLTQKSKNTIQEKTGVTWMLTSLRLSWVKSTCAEIWPGMT